jgi:hypothetical protein
MNTKGKEELKPWKQQKNANRFTMQPKTPTPKPVAAWYPTKTLSMLCMQYVTGVYTKQEKRETP